MKFKIIDEDATYRYKKINKKKDYSEWHNQVCMGSGIVDNRYPVSGMRVWMPWGLKMMEFIHNYAQGIIESQGGQRVFFPIVTPYEFAKKNESWWKKFEVEGYHAYKWNSEEQKFEGIGLLSPTGEPRMYPMYSLWIRSKNDMPIKAFQISHNYRNEKVTKALLRDREFWWMEYHCAFATEKEATHEAEKHLRLIKSIAEYIAVPIITVKKPDWEVFPGGIMSYENYVVMPDGKTVDAGSINNLGQAYSKKFDMKYTKDNGKEDYPWVVCTGYASRWLAGVLGFHGDDKGLILPTTIAPIQVIIVPIIKNNSSDKETKEAYKIMKQLEKECIRVDVDDRESSVGRKFFDWEIKGVPIRLEIGENEIKAKEVTLVRRDTKEKKAIKIIKLLETIKKELKEFDKRIYEKAKKQLEKQIITVKGFKEIMPVIRKGQIAKMHWCEEKKCYDQIMDLGKGEGLDAFGTDPKQAKTGVCITCGKKTQTILYAANTY